MVHQADIDGSSRGFVSGVIGIEDVFRNRVHGFAFP